MPVTTATAAATTSDDSPPPHNEQEVIARLNDKRQLLDALVLQVNELLAEVEEHALVIKALSAVDTRRKCFRLVGDVLVERNVGDTLPAVCRNMKQVEALAGRLQRASKAAAQDLQAKYQIRLHRVEDLHDVDRKALQHGPQEV